MYLRTNKVKLTFSLFYPHGEDGASYLTAAVMSFAYSYVYTSENTSIDGHCHYSIDIERVGHLS